MTNLIKPNGAADCAGRWAIVLAGGSGMRLQELIYRRRGDYLPKQYFDVIGKRSMLEHTLHRAEKLIPAQRHLVVIAKDHLQFNEVRRQIAWRPRESIIIQPENKDTGPGLLLPLLHLHKRDPAAVVTVLPSDHFILEEDRFMQHVEGACRIVEADGSRIVLLATEPSEPDPEYGYVLCGGKIANPALEDARTIEMFVEKPSADAAEMLIRKGALWNTMVLVATCNTLLQVIKRAAPGLYRLFEPIHDAIGTPDEQQVTERVYQMLPSFNLSKGVLEVLRYEHRRALLALPVRNVTWSNWATAARLSSTLRDLDASECAQSVSLLQDSKEVGGGLSKVTGRNPQANRLALVKRKVM
jgi:mannose-1-phosphate guanylyltransferase